MKQTIDTPRLLLRRFREQDYDGLYTLLSDPEVVRFEDYPPKPPEQTQNALNWRISSDEMWAIERKEDGAMLGNVYLGCREFYTLELGYLLNSAYWHQGYAKEAMHSQTSVFIRSKHAATCSIPIRGICWRHWGLSARAI